MRAKRWVCVLLAVILLLPLIPTEALGAENPWEDEFWKEFNAFSASVNTLLEQDEEELVSGITFALDRDTMTVNGEERDIVAKRKVTPYVKENQVMVPVRALADCEGAIVAYDGATRTATLETDEIRLSFADGVPSAVVADEQGEQISPLSVSPELVNGTMYVPIEHAAVPLGYDVEREEETVLLTKPYQTKRLVVKSPEPKLYDPQAEQIVEGFHDLHVLQYETEAEAREAYTRYSLDKTVEYVAVDSVVSVEAVESEVTHISWGPEFIGADEYNAFLQENTQLEEIVVAVADTGADSSHPLLSDRIIPVNRNFINSLATSNDGHSHGTHVAGIVVDSTLPNVKIKPIKVLDDQGHGTSLSIYNGLMFAVKDGCDVINMSLGGYGKSPLEEEAVAAAMDEGIPVVVSAGNDGMPAGLFSPARIQEAITVGALDKEMTAASYSNYGDVLDLWAPGTGVKSSIPGNRYGTKSGTSMAAPYVSAAAAMLKTWDKTLSSRQIEGILQSYAREEDIWEREGRLCKVLKLGGMKTLSPDRSMAVEEPVPNFAPGVYCQEELTLSLSSKTPNATIRYTTDGTAPTKNTGTEYTGPLTLQEPTRLIAKAFLDGAMDSFTLDAFYYVSPYPESVHYQNYDAYETWTYTSPDPEADYLRITFDEQTSLPFPQPAEDSSGYSAYIRALKYECGLWVFHQDGSQVKNEYGEIDRNYFVGDELSGKSILVKGNEATILLNLPMTENSYGFKVVGVELLYGDRLSPPTFQTDAGNTYANAPFGETVGPSYLNNQEGTEVTLSGEEGAQIYYTLDGSTPTEDSLLYTEPIRLSGPTKICAKSFKDGWVESEAVSEVYYASPYPESLHFQRREYYYNYVWQFDAPDNVSYMAVTFDEETSLNDSGQMSAFGSRICFYETTYEQSKYLGLGCKVTQFWGDDLSGQTLLVRGNWFQLQYTGFRPVGTEQIYGFKIKDIVYYDEEDQIVPAESIMIHGPEEIRLGEQVQLTAQVSPANATTEILWRVDESDGKTVRVDKNGLLTGNACGYANVYATSNLVNSVDADIHGFNGGRHQVQVWDENGISAKIVYSTTEPTNQDVTATLVHSSKLAVVNNGGSDSYVFPQNGSFTFLLKTEEEKYYTFTATVDWIDKTPPSATLSFEPNAPTNGDVMVTLEPSEPVTVLSTADGTPKLRLTENGTAAFSFRDRAGNMGRIEQQVDWIQKSQVSAEIDYKDLGEGELKATLRTSKPVTVKNNGGSAERRFTENGSFTFNFTDEAGNDGTATAVVCWLDEGITYNIAKSTTLPVTASLHLPEGAVVTNNQGKKTYTFRHNGSFTFTYRGFEGHTGSVTARVDWITSAPVEISNANELLRFADRVNEGDAFAFSTVCLTADIDMRGISWTPIGKNTTCPFSGVFDGNGHTISNLTSSNSSGQLQGLFGYTNAACIKNVALTGCFVMGKGYIGGIAGMFGGGKIVNCSCEGTVSGSYYVGGIAGGITSGQINACTMAGRVAGKSGGVGGIAGASASGTRLENCASAGTVENTGNSGYLGGIVGNLGGAVRRSYSICEITGNAEASRYLGGIAGVGSPGSTVESCLALGPKVTGPSGSQDWGRVVGINVASVGSSCVMKDNYAWSGMKLGENGKENTVEDDLLTPLTQQDGKGISPEEARAKELWQSAGFDFSSSWDWTEEKMPVPTGQEAFSWPEWLYMTPILISAPQENQLIYNGNEQALVSSGEARGGTVEYSMEETEGYSADVPTAENAGSYVVWYRVTGDAEYHDLHPVSLLVTIQKAPRPAAVPEDLAVAADTGLSDLPLPEGWSWKDPNAVLLTGENQLYVVYFDKDNYEQWEFPVTITMAERHVHELIKTEAREATCTAEGNLAYWTCAQCGAVFADELAQTVTTAQECALEKIPHTPGDWEVVTPATTKSEGLRQKACMQCGEVLESEAIPKVKPSSPIFSGPSTPQVPDEPLDDPQPTTWENTFADVGEGQWYFPAVQYVCENGLMTGYSQNQFGPSDTLTRAQLAQILYNQEEKPGAEGESAFVDVPQGVWYEPAVFWAAGQEIMFGYSESLFGPDDPVTREQMAAILYRYAMKKGHNVTGKSRDLSGFKDKNEISDWALPAMEWAYGQGILSGVGNGILLPTSSATRVQAAIMLMRFCTLPESSAE